MKILMFGRGSISTQYGWAFEKAGHTVEFYVRKGRKAELGSTVSLNIYDARKSIRGKLIQEIWPVNLIENIDLNHDYDLIIVCVQHYQIKKVTEFLASKAGKTTILISNNFWEEPSEQISSLRPEQIVWGFPQAGGGFDNKGTLNGAFFGSFIIGTFQAKLTDRSEIVIDLFKSAGIKSKVIKDFRSWLFGHFIMNAAIHLETLKAGEGINLINELQTSKHWKNVVANGKELLPLLKARNVDITASTDLKMFSLPPWVLSFGMKIAIKYLPPLKQVLIGHSNALETRSYPRDVLKTAEEMQMRLPKYEQYKNMYL